jgi:hypothetical protein
VIPETQISRNPGLRRPGFPEIRVFGDPDFQKSGSPDTRISGNPGIPMAGFLDLRLFTCVSSRCGAEHPTYRVDLGSGRVGVGRRLPGESF